jgi:hypothetical protein
MPATEVSYKHEKLFDLTENKRNNFELKERPFYLSDWQKSKCSSNSGQSVK